MQAFLTDFHLLCFIYIFYTGFMLAWAYDIVYSFLGCLHIFLRLVVDLLFAAITIYFLFLAILHSGAEELRLYMITGFLCGVLLYMQGIRVFIKKLISFFSIKRKTAKRGE